MQIDEWRQAGQRARKEGRVSVSVCVRACVHACVRKGPRLVFLIDLPRGLSDLQDNSKLNRCWWRWRDGKQDVQEERRKKEGKKTKNQ